MHPPWGTCTTDGKEKRKKPSIRWDKNPRPLCQEAWTLLPCHNRYPKFLEQIPAQWFHWMKIYFYFRCLTEVRSSSTHGEKTRQFYFDMKIIIPQIVIFAFFRFILCMLKASFCQGIALSLFREKDLVITRDFWTASVAIVGKYLSASFLDACACWSQDGWWTSSSADIAPTSLSFYFRHAGMLRPRWPGLRGAGKGQLLLTLHPGRLAHRRKTQNLPTFHFLRCKSDCLWGSPPGFATTDF